MELPGTRQGHPVVLAAYRELALPSSLLIHLDDQSCWQASLLQEGGLCQGLDNHPERLGRGKPTLASDSRTPIPGSPLPGSTKEEK